MYSQVSPLKTTPRSKRKEVELQDTHDQGKKIKLTLWKEAAEQPIPPQNSNVIVKNVYCKEFLDQPTLNSTQYTSIEVSYNFVNYKSIITMC